MSHQFPGGVCDDELHTAYLRTPAGELLAVDLGDGRVLWRRDRGGTPLAASQQHLLTTPQPDSGGLQLLDAASGEAVAGIPAGEMGSRDTDAAPVEVVDAQLEEGPDGPRVSLIGQRRYRGGAVPPADSRPGEQTQVSLAIDRASGEVRPIDAWSAPKREGLTPVAAAADTLAAARKHGTTFALRRAHGELVLEAHDARGNLQWSTSLGPLKDSRPPPLRP